MFRLLVIFLLLSCSKEPVPVDTEVQKHRETVKVAAIQCYNRMGEKEFNWLKLQKMITAAAEKGAKIIVLPEAAVTGYMDPANNITWTSSEAQEGELSLKGHAESISGKYISRYRKLAEELKVYLSIPFVEVADDKYYNSVILASPEGKVIAHHRKQSLWTHGDSGWCSEGDLETQVVETKFGRLGLMICYDVHSMPQKLAASKADIVLYSVGWFGPNTEDWYKRRFPEKYVVPNNFSVIAANWSYEKGKKGWEGVGWSNIVYRNGIVIKITDKEEGDEIVMADLPLN